MNIELRASFSLDDKGTWREVHAVSREAIISLESALHRMPQANLSVAHHFAEGVYVRELPIPASTVLVGKLHRQSHVTLLTKGDVSIITENGVERIQAPRTFVSPAGTKRAIYAHEDSILVTAHGSYETDMAELEHQLIAADYAELPDMLRLIE